jgi:predicted O-methyltransferase YrrM
LTSVDIEPEHQQAAREAFLGVGIPTQRFRLIAGPALSVLPRLSDRGYDMVFIDADKTEYAEYVEEGLRLLRYGGVLASTTPCGTTVRPMKATSMRRPKPSVRR